MESVTLVFVFYMGAELENVEQICIGHTAGKSSSEQLSAVAFQIVLPQRPPASEHNPHQAFLLGVLLWKLSQDLVWSCCVFLASDTLPANLFKGERIP